MRFALWGLGFVVDFGTPISAGQLHADLPPHAEHLPERFGLFTIIVLGEAIVAVVGGIAGQSWTFASAITAALSLVVAMSLWWIYFERHSGVAISAGTAERRVLVYEGWLYAHLPLVIGLTAAGVGVQGALRSTPGIPLAPPVRWLLAGAIALCLLTIAFMHWTDSTAIHRSARTVTSVRIAAALAAFGVALFGAGLPPLAVVGALAVICASQVAVDLRERRLRTPVGELANQPSGG
jgi:low temperature requirement protein LtrA